MELHPYPLDRNYGVTRCGRVYRIVRSLTGRQVPFEIAQTLNKATGYYFVGRGGERGLRTRTVHGMVAETFLPRVFGKSEVAHNNGVRTDNRSVNLRWATPAENAADKRRHGTHWQGVAHKQAKLTDADVTAIRQDPAPDSEIAVRYGVSRSLISGLQRGEGWSHVS